jgi:hypothetical protein
MCADLLNPHSLLLSDALQAALLALLNPIVKIINM